MVPDIGEENRSLIIVVGVALLGTIAKAFKKRSLDWHEFLAEIIVSLLVAFGLFHLGILQGISDHALYVSAVCWFTGVSLTRHAQWIVRFGTLLSKSKGYEN